MTLMENGQPEPTLVIETNGGRAKWQTWECQRVTKARMEHVHRISVLSFDMCKPCQNHVKHTQKRPRAAHRIILLQDDPMTHVHPSGFLFIRGNAPCFWRRRHVMSSKPGICQLPTALPRELHPDQRVDGAAHVFRASMFAGSPPGPSLESDEKGKATER